MPARCGGGIRHVSSHCNEYQRTVNSLFHLSFKSPGVKLGFGYSRIQELKQYCGISFSSFSSVLLPGDATRRLPATPGVKHWVDASSQGPPHTPSQPRRELVSYPLVPACCSKSLRGRRQPADDSWPGKGRRLTPDPPPVLGVPSAHSTCTTGPFEDAA